MHLYNTILPFVSCLNVGLLYMPERVTSTVSLDAAALCAAPRVFLGEPRPAPMV